MSILKVGTIQDTSGANPSTAEQIVKGRAKAWVNFDGTFGSSPFTVSNGGIRDAFNVTSVTDNGTGDYSITYTNAMPNVNYAAVLSWNIQSVNNRSCGHDNSNYLTTGMRVTIEDVNSSYGVGSSRADCNRICITIFVS